MTSLPDFDRIVMEANNFQLVESFFQPGHYWGVDVKRFRDTVQKYLLKLGRQGIYSVNSISCYYSCPSEHCPFYLRIATQQKKKLSGWYITPGPVPDPHRQRYPECTPPVSNPSRPPTVCAEVEGWLDKKSSGSSTDPHQSGSAL